MAGGRLTGLPAGVQPVAGVPRTYSVSTGCYQDMTLKVQLGRELKEEGGAF